GAAYSVGSPTISGYTANPATVSGTMGTEDVTVTVTYAAIPATHTLTVNYSVPEGVTAPEAHTEQVAENTSYSFTPPVITGHTANPATVSGTMGTEDVSVTVTYTAETATGNLTAAGGLLAASSDASDTSSELQDQPSRATYKVTVTNGTGGTATGGGEGIAANTNITVTATANAGYKFLNWTENGSVVSSAASYAFAVTADRVLVANFEQINYDVKIVTPAHGKITADKATAHYGDTVTLTIAADTGYEFTGLEVKKPDGSKLTVNNNAFTMPDCNVTVSATFEAIIYSVTGGANGSWIKGTLLPYSITAKRSPTDNCAGHFTGVVIDNTILPITDYTVSYGSVVVTIMPYALQRLSNGVHTVTLWFDDGIVSTFLYIWADPRYPATGDERQTTMWAALSGSTLLGMGAILILGRIYGKKKKKNKD
ncbi:MAG: MucBP domain-containing protein, partial [Oscillospiraceae bacterium]|nr:MucBP domain-containing protein [Oscillospiraceae bacterium]